MQKKTEIICGVTNCVYNHEQKCDAETITVSCNNCIKPHDCHETECKSFRTGSSF